MITTSFILNGQKVTMTTKEETTLLEALRDQLHLTAAKEGCGKGECGACTVLLNQKPVNACLVLLSQISNQEITTLEGLLQNKTIVKLSKSFEQKGAVQCGFCTPGMMISSFALLEKVKNPSILQITKALEGNICRCTGYKKIIEAVKEASQQDSSL